MGRRKNKAGAKAQNGPGSKAKPPVVKRLESQGRAKRMVGGLIPQMSALAGNYLGGPLGGAVGLAAGKLISSITGFGDYRVNSNTITAGNSVPTFKQGGHGVRMCHREFISDVTGSVEFKNTSYSINPGLPRSFPWLSLMGDHFEEYEMKGLVFEYRPSSGSAVSSTSSALGVVVMATDYDPVNDPFPNKQVMESYEFSNSTVPFNGCMHPVECARGRNVMDNLYLRKDDTELVDQDRRFYDMGNFQIATVGMQSSYVVGELWVSYDCIFKKPRLPISLSTPCIKYAYVVENPEGSTGSQILGPGGGLLIPSSTLTIDDVAPFSNGVIIKKSGTYYLTLTLGPLYATSTTVLNTTFGTNVSSFNGLFTGTTFFQSAQGNVGDVIQHRTLNVSADGVGADNAITWVPINGLPGQKCDLFLFKITNVPTAGRSGSTSGVMSSRTSLSTSFPSSSCHQLISDGWCETKI